MPVDQDTIHALATEIANQTISSNWLFYIIIAFITAILSAIGAFLSTYFGKRAELRALTTDFGEIKRQLHESTSISESIKADIKRLSDRSEKLQWMKREKLEQYVVAVLRGVEFLSQDMRHHFFSAEAPTYDDPMLTATMLQSLYLPELDQQHAALLQSTCTFRQWVANGMQQRIDAARESGIQITQCTPTQAHLDQYADQLASLNPCVVLIQEAAKQLARELNKA